MHNSSLQKLRLWASTTTGVFYRKILIKINQGNSGITSLEIAKALPVNHSLEILGVTTNSSTNPMCE